MKAISLWQPWASLVIEGIKRFETRGFSTKIRGPVAIHAAKTKKGFDLFNFPKPLLGILAERNAKPFSFGCVLGIVSIEDVSETEHYTRCSTIVIPDLELQLGDWSAGRYAWKLKVIEKFDTPIPAKGKQGFFNWEKP